MVDIKVENVTNLFGVSFVLHYTHNADFIDALSAVKGDFLGSDVIFLDPVIDDGAGTVSIGITRKRPAEGVTGSGVIARVTFTSDAMTPDDTPVDFTLTDIVANDPDGGAIPLTPQPLRVFIGEVTTAIIKPVAASPANSTGSDKIYTLTVTASDSTDPNIKDTGEVNVTVEAVASTITAIKDVTVSNITSSSATICWVSKGTPDGITTDNTVSYGVNSPDELTANDPRNSDVHYVVLIGLQPETTYKYNVTSGNLTDGKIYEFMTTKSVQPGNNTIWTSRCDSSLSAKLRLIRPFAHSPIRPRFAAHSPIPI